MLHLVLLLSCAPAQLSGAGGGVDDGGADGGVDGGAAGDGGGGDGDGGGSPSGAFELTVDDAVVTMLRASWTYSGADDTWVEYRFETDNWLVAPVVAPGSAVLLGIPALTEVEAQLVEVTDGTELRSEVLTATTGALPPDLLLPSIDAWDAALADAAPYVMVSVAGGDDYTFEGPYWIEVFDREGRIVWYHELPDDMFCFYPSVALDGRHIWYEGSDPFGLGRDNPYLMRRTLDGRWSLRIDIPDLGQATGEGPDGTFFYEQRTNNSVALMQVDADGDATTIWDCDAWMADHGEAAHQCYMNTTNWSAAQNSVLTSMFYSDTVFEIDLDTGEPIRQFGQLSVGDPYDFSPASSMFAYQHFPNWTDDGTLLVSTHKVGTSGVQYASEYAVDDDNTTLTRIWTYESTEDWATQLGEALRLRNGNTIQGYGQDGAAREVTPDGETAWHVSWEKEDSGYRVIGHLSLIDDLYALNQGPE